MIAATLACVGRQSSGDAQPNAANVTGLDAPDAVQLTWLSVTNWLLEAGDTRLLFDGYVTRIDRRVVDDNGFSSARAAIDRRLLERISGAVIPDRKLALILVGHAHWDHAFDAPGWAKLTDARIGGARTVCHQAVALGVPANRCTPLEGGETFEVGPFVRVRVVRWHHSGDSSATGRRLRAPLELRGPPRAVNGGLRPGFLEDYPNGGGSRAYLVTVRTRRGPVTLFWSNTANPQAWDAPVPVDSIYFREQGVDLSHVEWAGTPEPTEDALARAMRAEGINGVDVWLGFPSATHVRQVGSLLRPRVFIPHHWDDYWAPVTAGVRTPFRAPAVLAALQEMGARTVVPTNYFDRFRVEGGRVTPVANDGLRERLGVAGLGRGQ